MLKKFLVVIASLVIINALMLYDPAEEAEDYQTRYSQAEHLLREYGYTSIQINEILKPS